MKEGSKIRVIKNFYDEEDLMEVVGLEGLVTKIEYGGRSLLPKIWVKITTEGFYNGTLALQMDFRISHWLRELCDKYFGYKNCVNVIQWCYSSGGSSKNKLNQKNDEIIIYAKNKKKQKFNYMTEKSYNRDFKPYRFKGVEEFEDEYGRWYTMVGMKCIWSDIPMVGRTSKERIGYSTQKPIKLMNRIRDLYTDEGDVIADFFCGSGTMLVSAKEGNRRYIGCDINPEAVKVTNERLNEVIIDGYRTI